MRPLEFRHRSLDQAELTKDRCCFQDLSRGQLIWLMSAWLIDVTGVSYTPQTMQYDERGRAQWIDLSEHYHGPAPTELGISRVQMEAILDSSSDLSVPEPTLVLNEGRLQERLGFAVWGMGQHFVPILHKGEVRPGVPEVPDDKWFIANIYPSL
jgi:hypothetical protein